MVTTAICCVKRRRKRQQIEERGKIEKEEVNDVYGTYARGADGEGDYGDGDKVYISDSNVYYGS